jgi:hypothetical protein
LVVEFQVKNQNKFANVHQAFIRLSNSKSGNEVVAVAKNNGKQYVAQFVSSELLPYLY